MGDLPLAMTHNCYAEDTCRPSMRARSAAAVAIATLVAAPTFAAGEGWTRAWTASMWQAGEADMLPVHDATLRSAVRVAASGKALRIRLANDYGPRLAIGAAAVGRRGGPAVRVTFSGSTRATLETGAPLISDPVPLAVAAFDVLEVSLYVPGPAQLTTVHETSGQPVRISSPGDHTAEAFTAVSTAPMRPLVAGIDVLTGDARPVIVAIGDSVTDNGSCPLDEVPICRWSEVLGRRLAGAGMPHVVVAQAISGNRMLSTGTGPSILSRLDRDVLAMPHVTHIVLLAGINDIGFSGLIRRGIANPPIAAVDLISGYRQLVARAHERGIKVIAMTLLPFEGAFYYSAERDALRQEVNRWIRTSGAFDGVVDAEARVADPADPRRLAEDLQRGDDLHPNGRGETRIGEAIDLRLFRR